MLKLLLEATGPLVHSVCALRISRVGPAVLLLRVAIKTLPGAHPERMDFAASGLVPWKRNHLSDFGHWGRARRVAALG